MQGQLVVFTWQTPHRVPMGSQVPARMNLFSNILIGEEAELIDLLDSSSRWSLNGNCAVRGNRVHCGGWGWCGGDQCSEAGPKGIQLQNPSPGTWDK